MQDNQNGSSYLIPASVMITGILIAISIYYSGSGTTPAPVKIDAEAGVHRALEKGVLSPEGVVLPVRWGDLGVKMASVGVIDREKLESLYAGRGGLGQEEKKLLEGTQNGELKITENNSGFLLNLFWALGLGTKNDILETGPMADPRYGGAGPPAGGFASTGGWTLADGNAMNHYSRHPFVILTPEQQKSVERVSKNIYRPCCNNPTHFPDCNHGMAMLGLLELMASQGVSEDQMYRTALQVNSFWFPDTYFAIATYLELKGTEWGKADPKEILGYAFSSASGYRRILEEIPAQNETQGSRCGIEPQKQQGSGCGV